MKLLGVSILITAAAGSYAQLINGDFEAGTVPNPFPGWTSTGTAGLEAAGGNPGQCVSFTFGGGDIRQTFDCHDADGGEFCDLAVYYKAAPGTTFSVTFTGVGGNASFTNATPGVLSDNLWHSKILEAPCGIVTVVLAGNGTAAGGKVFFDSLTADCVPEPASLAAIGLGTIGIVRRRKV